MKTKTKPRKVAHKPIAAKYDRVPLAGRTAADILKGINANKIAPTTTRSHAVPPSTPANPPLEGGFSEMYHARGGRLWFQVVATPTLRARVEMLKAKVGARTLNDLAARLFDDAFVRYNIL